MAYGMEFLGGLGQFAKSGIGQAAIGAGLGYGADRLSGGSGGKGALLGGALGGLNAGFSDGGFFGQDAYTGSIADQAVSGMGNMLGGTKQNADQLAYNKQYMSVPDAYRTPAVESALEQGYRNLATPKPSILGGISNFRDTYGDAIKTGTDIVSSIGDYQAKESEQGYNEAQMNYIQSLQRQQELENAYKRNARATTQTGANAGFANSSLGSPSNYYSA